MSEAEKTAPTIEERMFGAKKEETVEKSDTTGTPDDDTLAEGDGALATENPDDKAADTEDGTPDDEDSEGGGFEQRFKDTQAKLTETSQQLSDLRNEYAAQAGELTEAGLELQDKLAEVEETAQFYAQIAQQDLMQLRQVNVGQLDQKQYAQWQQSMQVAQQRAGMLQQRLEAVKAHSKQAKEATITRAATIARARLTKAIPNFDDAYPEIGKYAVSQGVNPNVFKEITDPGLIMIIHGAMQASSAPDTIEEVSRTIQAKRQTGKTVTPAQRPGPKSLAERMYGSTK